MTAIYYLVRQCMDRHSYYDERRFESKAGGDEEFNRLYDLPARDHNWEYLQLWEIDESKTPPGTLLREERGK
jgi:hypothetical protein